MQRTIPDEHRDRLIEAGYIREVVRSYEGVHALALTGRGLRRLELGKQADCRQRLLGRLAVSKHAVAIHNRLRGLPIAVTPLCCFGVACLNCF